MKSAWTNKSTCVLLGTIAVLLAANLLLNLPGSGLPKAQATGGGLPDTGAQTERMIDELAKLNKNVEKLQSFLESRTISAAATIWPPSAR